MTENESSSFQPVSGISQQQIQDMEERIVELERRVDEMTNHQDSSKPTKPITQEDIVNALNILSIVLGVLCIGFAVVAYLQYLFLMIQNPSNSLDSANFDMSLIWFISGLPLLLFGWFKGFSKIVTFKTEET